MIPISAAVISFNEDDRIGRCLDSLTFCDELVVLDSGSTDRTRAIAAERGARVELQVPFLGHRAQKQAAVELVRNDWVLSLDCDEVVTPELRQELVEVLAEPPAAEVVGFSLPRRNIYLGRVMHHGLFWPDRKLRLFDRRRARWGGVDPHDRVELVGGGRVVSLRAPIQHDSYRSFGEHRATVAKFATIAARSMAAEGRRVGPLAPWAHAGGAFVRGWLLKRGVLDGWRGLVAAAMSARYDWLKYRQLRALLRVAETQR